MFGNFHPGSAVNLLQGDADDPAAVAGSLGLYTEEEKARAFELLDEVRLGEFAYRRADQLSGVQKQRVGIARSLIQDPKIILCDEPIAPPLTPRAPGWSWSIMRNVPMTACAVSSSSMPMRSAAVIAGRARPGLWDR